MKIVGLFSGIGGLELPFHGRGAKTQLLCENWDPARRVLLDRFPDVEVHGDIRELTSLPGDVDTVTAGFPCTDLSQAGRTAGIQGNASGLVAHVFRLLEGRHIEWLVLENVRNMLMLDKGRAMHYLTTQLESLGFRWAYRLVDSRFSGVPQRRHRVLLVASRHHDPREVLFADNAHEPPDHDFRADACGFYWTEGFTGLGWAKDAVPPLKGGSTVGIPSPPAIWRPGAPLGARIVTPTVEDAEVMQGFDRGWTAPAEDGRANGPRWKLVGNAVTVPVADWLVGRIYQPGEVAVDSVPFSSGERWPDAAYGEAGRLWRFSATAWPVRAKYRHLTEVLTEGKLKALSQRATAGFLQRANRSRLRFDLRFLDDVRQHLQFMQETEGSGDLFRCAAIA